MRKIWITSMATVSAAAMLTAPAWAQSAQEAARVDAKAETPSANSPPSTEAIIVTGTRITTGGFDQPTPVTVVNTDELIKRAPGQLADALNQLPAFQNSINVNQQQFAQANRQRTGNYLNLRSLGTQRVLVLQDGLRLPVTGTNGGVDVTLIPQLLTQRIEVVTGGASAAYGSDAVSGVVNYILDKRFKGIKAQAQYGTATGGHSDSYRLGAAVGTSFLDNRLHVIASLERSHTEPVLRTDLKGVGDLWVPVGAGTAADPIRYVDNVRFGGANTAGVTINGPAGFRGMQFGQNGELLPYDPGAPAGNPGFQIGGDGGIIGQECCTITPGHTANQAFGRLEYEFTDNLSGFVSVGYNWSEAHDYPLFILSPLTTLFRENAYLAPSALAALGSEASFNIGKLINDQKGYDIRQYSNSLNIVTGINGRLFESLDWSIGYVHGETTFRTTQAMPDNPKYYAALDAVRDSSGNIVCRVTLTNPGLYPGCVPLNLLGEGTASAAALEYITGVSRYKIVNQMDSIQANLSGRLFEGWAGPVSFALGGEYREASLKQTSNSDPAVQYDLTGLRGVPATARTQFGLSISPAEGSYNIKEVFAELNVPVLRGSPIGSLDLNGAVRYTDYSTSGGVTTWKLGGVFDPIDGLRIRTTVSRDIRAPTLYELFSGQTVNVITFSDRLTNQSVQSRNISGGNPNLTPEIANTLTVGMVIKPAFIPGLNFSADFFRIKISDAIGTPFSAFQIVDLCYASNFTSPLCDQIERPLGPSNPDPSNAPTRVFTNVQNLSRLSLSGIDFELSYGRPLGNGRINAQIRATRQLTFEQTAAPGQPTIKYVGTADFNDVQYPLPLPKWRATMNLGYDSDSFGINVQERIIGGYDRSHQLVYADDKVSAVAYTDLSLTYKLQTRAIGQAELFATVNNLFDRDAPLLPVTRTPGSTVPTIRNTYDVIGRYVTIGVRMKM